MSLGDRSLFFALSRSFSASFTNFYKKVQSIRAWMLDIKGNTNDTNYYSNCILLTTFVQSEMSWSQFWRLAKEVGEKPMSRSKTPTHIRRKTGKAGTDSKPAMSPGLMLETNPPLSTTPQTQKVSVKNKTNKKKNRKIRSTKYHAKSRHCNTNYKNTPKTQALRGLHTDKTF